MHLDGQDLSWTFTVSEKSPLSEFQVFILKTVEKVDERTLPEIYTNSPSQIK